MREEAGGVSYHLFVRSFYACSKGFECILKLAVERCWGVTLEGSIHPEKSLGEMVTM